jgi:hypothetical protein
MVHRDSSGVLYANSEPKHARSFHQPVDLFPVQIVFLYPVFLNGQRLQCSLLALIFRENFCEIPT